jgi:hypothetical protein
MVLCIVSGSVAHFLVSDHDESVLKACANVFCGEDDNDEFVQSVFEECCKDGQVSFGVCYQLRQAASSELYRKLIPNISRA